MIPVPSFRCCLNGLTTSDGQLDCQTQVGKLLIHYGIESPKTGRLVAVGKSPRFSRRAGALTDPLAGFFAIG